MYGGSYVLLFILSSALLKTSADVYKVELENAIQSTTYGQGSAGDAIDDDMSTFSHTICEWDTAIWFKADFTEESCVTKVWVTNSKDNGLNVRVDDTDIYVTQSGISEGILCGTLEYKRGDPTLRAVTCEEPICGVGIELRVIHPSSDARYNYEACLHFKEIEVYAPVMRFKLVSPTSEQQIWDVKLITLTDDHGNKLPVTEFFDSNHAELPKDRYTPVQAFTDNKRCWGGRKDDNGVFEIGGEIPYFQGNTLTVELLHPGPIHAVTQGVQFMVEKNGIWEEKCIMTMKSEVFNGPEVDEYAMYCKIEEWN